MKKLLLASIAFIAISMAVNAQAGFRLGAKAGLNMSQVVGTSFNDGFYYSYHLGGFAEIDFNKLIGIQPELLWNQSTTQSASGISSINLNPNQNVTLNYLSIPILLRVNLGSMLTLNAGPQFSILMNKNDNLLQNGQKAFASGDFGMVGGATLNLKTFRIYGRYVVGLKDIHEISQQDKWTNQQIQLGIGLKL